MRIDGKIGARLAWSFMAVSILFLAVGFVLTLTGHYGPRQSLLDGIGFLPLVVIYPIVGVLIASRHPRNPIGWIMIAVGFAGGLSGLLSGYLSWAARPQPWPGVGLAAQIVAWSWLPVIVPPVTFLLLLFPDGHLPSRRWRWAGWMAGAAMILPSIPLLLTPGPIDGYPGVDNPLGMPALRPALEVIFFSIAFVPLSAIACTAGMVVRFRRSKGRERLQLKWLTAAAATVGTLYASSFLFQGVSEATKTSAPLLSDALLVVINIVIFSFALIPIAIGVSILRHNLYDIGRIISRTLAYTLSVGAVVAAYFGLVLLTTTITPLQSDSPLVVALITLMLAAAFRPLLNRLKHVLDKRFNRAGYNAGLVLDVFARRVRDEVDVTAVRGHLVAAVDASMEPAAVSLWLNEQVAPAQEASR